MDPAGEDYVRSALAHQGALIGHHASQLSTTSQEVDSLTTQMANLSGQVQAIQQEIRAPFLTHSNPEPHANNPPPYDGDPNSCQAFLSQCSLVFALQPCRYATEKTKVAYVITLLTGKARAWGTAMWDAQSPICSSFDEFSSEMKKLFDRSVRGDEAAAKLVRLRQKNQTVTDYLIQFKTLSAECKWDKGALRTLFREGLDTQIQDEMAVQETPADLEDLISLALRIEARIQLRRRRLAPRSAWDFAKDSQGVECPPSLSPSDPEPMQLGRLHLSAQEKQHRLARGLCLYCGNSGHRISTCPLKGKAH